MLLVFLLLFLPLPHFPFLLFLLLRLLLRLLLFLLMHLLQLQGLGGGTDSLRWKALHLRCRLEVSALQLRIDLKVSAFYGSAFSSFGCS